MTLLEQVRVLIVDDHEIVRAGLVALLRREKDIQVVGQAADAEDALSIFDECKPDVAVVDYGLPGMSGLELCERIIRLHPDFPVVILTNYMADDVLRNAVDAGARAYIYKDIEGKELMRAIRAAVKGESVLDTKAVGRVMEWANRTKNVGRGTALSKKETEVLRLVAAGASNAAIGRELFLSTNTVKTYLRRILQKLGCYTRAEAAAVATKRGLL